MSPALRNNIIAVIIDLMACELTPDMHTNVAWLRTVLVEKRQLTMLSCYYRDMHRGYDKCAAGAATALLITTK